jgi:hypothetical protein
VNEQAEEQAVLVFIKLGGDAFPVPSEREALLALEERVDRAIQGSNLGEFDGNEIGEGYWRLYSYGPSADRLSEIVIPILSKWPVPAGSYLLKRLGGPGAAEERIDLQAQR